MRFATRTFLSSFIPFAVLLAVSFWAIRASVMETVRDGLRASVRDNEVALAREQARNEGRNRKLLEGIGENPSLKACLQLLAAEGGATEQARNTVQDQLSEICDSLSFDFIMVSGAGGEPLAAVVRYAGGFAPVNLSRLHPPEQGFFPPMAGSTKSLRFRCAKLTHRLRRLPWVAVSISPDSACPLFCCTVAR